MHLTIDYLLEGQRRGYNFTSPTDAVNPDALKQIWRSAMPRGQGWGEGRFQGANTLKTIELPRAEIAVCDVQVTDLRDEVGRTGIRRAQIEIMTVQDAQQHLIERLHQLPSEIVRSAETRLGSREWQLLFKKHRDGNRNVFKPQSILAYPYSGDGWQFMEACLLLLVTRSTFLTNLIEVTPKVNPFADKLISFTTLALDFREENRLIAMPLDIAQKHPNLTYVDLSSA